MSVLLHRLQNFFTYFFLLNHPYLKKPFLISLLLSFILSLTVLVLFTSLQPQVPMFYSLAEPQDFLVSKFWLILFPVISFFLTIFHFFAIRFFGEHERVVPTLFAWGTVVCQVIFAIAFFRIIFITG